MYTGQLDIGEGSVPQLVATAQFLDMPLLEQLLQTHAMAANTSTPTANNATPSPATRPVRNSRTPLRGSTVSYSPHRNARTSGKADLLPAGPSRIDLEVNWISPCCARGLFISHRMCFYLGNRWAIMPANSEVSRNCPSCLAWTLPGRSSTLRCFR